MSKVTLFAASALLLAMASSSYAAPKGTGGASEYSPGDRMQDAGGVKGKGASQFAPGHEMKRKSSRGASELSPGDQMNDYRK